MKNKINVFSYQELYVNLFQRNPTMLKDIIQVNQHALKLSTQFQRLQGRKRGKKSNALLISDFADACYGYHVCWFWWSYINISWYSEKLRGADQKHWNAGKDMEDYNNPIRKGLMIKLWTSSGRLLLASLILYRLLFVHTWYYLHTQQAGPAKRVIAELVLITKIDVLESFHVVTRIHHQEEP